MQNILTSKHCILTESATVAIAWRLPTDAAVYNLFANLRHAVFNTIIDGILFFGWMLADEIDRELS